MKAIKVTLRFGHRMAVTIHCSGAGFTVSRFLNYETKKSRHQEPIY